MQVNIWKLQGFREKSVVVKQGETAIFGRETREITAEIIVLAQQIQ